MRDEAKLDAAKFPPRSFAVLPLAADPADSVAVILSWAMTEMLSQDLARTERLEVVERRRIGALIAELSLAGSGRVDTVTAPRAGRLLGARRVASGRITRGGTEQYRIEFHTVDVASGVISAPFGATFSLDNVAAAEASLVEQIVKSLGMGAAELVRISAGYRAPVPTVAMLRFGRGIELLANGNTAAARGPLQQAAKLAPNFIALGAPLEESNVANTSAEAGRRGRLRGVARVVSPLSAVRTAEAVDATSSSLVRQVSLSVIVILP